MLHFTRPENNNNNTKGHTNGAPTEDKGLHLNCVFCGHGRGKYIYCNDNIISFPLVKCGKKKKKRARGRMLGLRRGGRTGLCAAGFWLQLWASESR